MLSVIIPSCRDPYLQKTIDSLLENSEGEVEIIPVLDGYPPISSLKEDHRMRIVSLKNNQGMRGAINVGATASKGEYIMKTDAHCIFGKGFDKILLEEIKDNWVVTPRRYKLDVEKWEIMDEPPVDIDRLITDRPDKIGALEWRSRQEERKEVLVDETMLFQGSCWVMSRKHWDWLGGLQEEGYGSFTQEPVEICLKTWLGGGRVMVNKGTWYAHKHGKFGRTARINTAETKAGNAYSRDFWLNNRWDKRIHDLEWLMRRFGLSR